MPHCSVLKLFFRDYTDLSTDSAITSLSVKNPVSKKETGFHIRVVTTLLKVQKSCVAYLLAEIRFSVFNVSAYNFNQFQTFTFY